MNQNKSNQNKWLTVVKRVWTAMIILGLGYYFSKNYQGILQHLQSISWVQFLLSAALLVIGKLFLAEMSRLSVLGDQWRPTYKKMLHLYSTIQLSKYLPGGIWHFVGRFGVYRVNGMDNHDASRSIIVENVWLISSALLFGGAISLTNESILSLIGLTPSSLLKLILILACLVIWIIVNLVINHIFIKRKENALTVVRQILIQSTVWLFIGLSFFVLLPPDRMNLQTASLATGGFTIGWAVGYVAIFAPSGIGVREAIITAILATQLSPTEAALYAAISRIVWVVTEICLGIFAELVLGSGNLRKFFSRKQEEDIAA
ncbi:MAG: hypothetical protein HPY76_11735 [Anaerolineae bacterium]|nr:hypothetical protein [Anaerolineae bacterium]